jgi:hypothetical protein
MAFDIPRGRIVPLGDIRLELAAGRHPFEVGREAAIAATWQREFAANPNLFDGELLLFSALAVENGSLVGRAHTVRYSTFLHWRSLRPVPGAEHLYAHAMLVSSDGILIAARMAGTTVNAGQAYFASGSFEPVDAAGGLLDPHANMRREVLEETGLDIDGARREAGFQFLSMPTGNVIARRYWLDDTAAGVARRIEAHIQGLDDSEITAPVMIGSLKNLPERLAPQMPPLIAWHFTG